MALADIARKPKDEEEEIITDKIKGDIETFTGFFAAVEDSILERDAELMQIRLALLTKQHVLLQGRTGTAKSLLVRRTLNNILIDQKDSDPKPSVFAIQMAKGMGDEYLFGGINVKEMKESGKIIHVLDGMFPRKRFAFIDEVFDASDNTLRAMLEVLNERTFTRGPQREKASLHTAILTSNYRRENEVTEAILDRILFKAEVKKVTEPKARMAMYLTHLAAKDKETLSIPAMSYNVLSRLVSATNRVKMSEETLELYDEVIREFEEQGRGYISDRKANVVLGVLRAAALLEGRDEVNLDDLEALRFVLVVANDAKQEEVLMNVMKKTIGVMKDRQVQVRQLDLVKKEHESIKSLYGRLDNLSDKQKLELVRRVKDQVGALQQRPSAQHRHNDIEEVYKEIVEAGEEMIKGGLGKLGLS